MVYGGHLGNTGMVVLNHNLCINYPGVHDFVFSFFLSGPVSQISPGFGQIVIDRCSPYPPCRAGQLRLHSGEGSSLLPSHGFWIVAWQT